MSEEVEQESTAKSFKGIIITLVSTVTLGVGGFVTNKLTGGDEKEAPVQQAAPVININNTQTQQQSAGGTTKVIERERVVEKEKPAPKPKKEADEFKEKPAAW
jgi:hypothetical protein